MSSVVISGYYGFGNLGDEAVLAGMVSTFQELAPQVVLAVLSAAPQETETLHAVNAVPRSDLFAVLRAIRRCDLFISGGGGLLQDRTSQRSLLYYLGLLYVAQRCGCKTMVMGQGVGPLLRASSRWLAGRALSRTNAITVRDEQSALLLRQIAPKAPPAEVTADLAFAMPVPRRAPGAARADVAQGFDPALADLKVCATRKTAEQRGERVIGVSLRPWAGQERWLPEVSSAVNVLREEGFKPLFIPFHSPEDRGLCRCLAYQGAASMSDDVGADTSSGLSGGVPSPPSLDKLVEAADNLTTPQQVLGIIGETGLLLGMRLHSLVFGAMVGVPCVALAYDPKVEALAEVAGMPCLRLEAIRAEEIVAEVRTLWHRRKEEGQRLLAWAEQNRRKARRNAEVALGLLSG